MDEARRRRLALIAAIGVGLLAVVAIRRYLQDERHRQLQDLELVDVVAAAQDLPAGTRLDRPMLQSRAIPLVYVHDKTIRLSDLNTLLGQVVQYAVKTGEPLLWTTVGSPHGRGLSGVVLKGERAVTLAVDEMAGVAGMIQPNDHVDILGTFHERTVLLLQNVLVLAAGGMVSDPTRAEGGGYASITVSVSPEAAALLVYGQSQGRLTLLLRHALDVEPLADPTAMTYDPGKFKDRIGQLPARRRAAEPRPEAP